MQQKKAGRNSESGYALLFIYALAAAAAIMLYLELPRVAFEAQRDKEQLLIDRGEQYSRAVMLYVHKYQKFPADMDALENTGGIRFLRRKYVDPMTGKADWRIIHVGPGGVFLDSVLHSNKDAKNAPQTFITEIPFSGTAAGGNEGVNLATRRRPSDQGGAASGDPASSPTGDASPAVNGPVMVLPDGRIVPANLTGTAPANATQTSQTGTIPGQAIGSPGQNGAPGFAGIQTPNGIAFQPGTPGAPPNAAANLINQILTTPRPPPGTGGGAGIDQFGNALPQQVGVAQQQSGGFGGQSVGGIGGSTGGQVVGGGFAGVASKAERESIKSYGDRTAYNEWEFVFDVTKDPTRNTAGGRGGIGPNGSQGGGRGATSAASGASPK